MHKCIKHTQSHKFFKKLFRIKSPSDYLPPGPILKSEHKTNKQVYKGLERLSKTLKEMQILEGRKGGLIK